MTKKVFLAACAAIVCGCSTVQNEEFSTIVLNGREYDLRTRTMQGANGTFVTHSVRTNSGYRMCDPGSPGSCEAAIRNSRRGLNG